MRRRHTIIVCSVNFWNEPDCHFPGRLSDQAGSTATVRCAPAPGRKRDHGTGDRYVYGSGTGPKSGGGMRCFVAASYAEAIRKSVGSAKGLPKNMIPTGSFAGMGPARRLPSPAVASRTLSNTCVVKPAGTDSVEKPCCPKRPQTELVLPANGGSTGAPKT